MKGVLFMTLTNSCRKCSKKFCENRGKIENCKECVSFVWLSLQELDKKLTPVEEVYSNVGIRKN